MKDLTKKEKAIFIAGLFEGAEELAKTLKGSCGFTAGNMVSTAIYNYLKKNKIEKDFIIPKQ